MAVSIGEIREDTLASLREALPHAGRSAQSGTRPITTIERKCLMFAFRDNFSVEQVYMATRIPKHALRAVLDGHNATADERVVPDGTAGGRVSPLTLAYQQQVALCEAYTNGRTVRELACQYKSRITGEYVSEQFVRDLLKRHGYFEKVDEKAKLERRKRVWEMRSSGKTVAHVSRSLGISSTTVTNDWKWCKKEWGAKGPPVEAV